VNTERHSRRVPKDCIHTQWTGHRAGGGGRHWIWWTEWKGGKWGVRGVTDVRKRHATEDNIRGTSAVGDMETLEPKGTESITLRCSGAKASR
jgi:hypothetical protein